MKETAETQKARCAWVPLDKGDYVAYHDDEWGQPVHDDRLLFEMLMLEGAQAGLSWYTVLRKRAAYRALFKNFDVKKVAQMTDAELKKILLDSRIVRNRLKVFSARQNARAFILIQKEFGSFDAYLTKMLGEKPIVHRALSMREMLVTIPESEALAKDLKKRGMTFVGDSIMYAYLQAIGRVDDHMQGCYRAT